MGGIIGGVIAGAAGIGSAVMGSNAASSAANAQLQASEDATATQWKMFNTAWKGQAPWRTAGGTAIGQMEKSLTPGGQSAYQQTPGYLYQLAQGTQAANQGAAATGMLLSGQQQKALTQYGQGAATSDYQAYLNNLATVSGQGSGVAVSGGNQAIQTGQGMAQTQLYGGNARASGYLMQNAAIQQGIGNAYNAMNGGGVGGFLSNLLNGSSGGSLVTNPTDQQMSSWISDM